MVEVKTDLTSVEATLRKHDEKVRLSPAIVRERFGWVPWTVARLLVLPSASTPRRRVAALAEILDRVYPLREDTLREWLHRPVGRGDGILFAGLRRRPSTTPSRRVRRPA